MSSNKTSFLNHNQFVAIIVVVVIVIVVVVIVIVVITSRTCALVGVGIEL